jgi:hypothetical protein
MVNGVAFDASGNLAIAGDLDAFSFDLGGGSLPPIGKADLYGNADGFVLVLDHRGNYVWAKRFGGTNATTSATEITASNGGFALGGTLDGTMIDWGNGATLTVTGTGTGARLYVAKLDSNGNHVWSNAYGVPTTQGIYTQFAGIASTARGNPVVAGFYFEGISFGSQALPISNDSVSKVFVAELARADGSAIFSRSSASGAAATKSSFAGGIATGGNGVYVSGYFTGAIDFGGLPESAAMSSFFVLKLAP